MCLLKKEDPGKEVALQFLEEMCIVRERAKAAVRSKRRRELAKAKSAPSSQKHDLEAPSPETDVSPAKSLSSTSPGRKMTFWLPSGISRSVKQRFAEQGKKH